MAERRTQKAGSLSGGEGARPLPAVAHLTIVARMVFRGSRASAAAAFGSERLTGVTGAGGAPVAADLISGKIQVSFSPLVEVLQQGLRACGLPMEAIQLVFGTARRLFLEMGRRLCAERVLDDAEDVFYLEVEELFEEELLLVLPPDDAGDLRGADVQARDDVLILILHLVTVVMALFFLCRLLDRRSAGRYDHIGASRRAAA